MLLIYTSHILVDTATCDVIRGRFPKLLVPANPHLAEGALYRPMSHFLLPQTQSRVIELLVVVSNNIGGGIHTE